MLPVAIVTSFVRFLQHGALLGLSDSSSPQLLQDVQAFLAAITFESERLFDYVKVYIKVPSLTFQARFVMFSQIVPLLIALSIVSVFRGLKFGFLLLIVLLAFFLVACGIIFLVVGIKKDSKSGVLVAAITITAGVLSLILLCSVKMCCSSLRKRNAASNNQGDMGLPKSDSNLEELEQYYKSHDKYKPLPTLTKLSLVSTIVILVASSTFFLAFSVNCEPLRNYLLTIGVDNSVHYVFGGVLMFFAVMVVLYFIFAVLPPTQSILRKVKHYFYTFFLQLVLFLLKALYIPVAMSSSQVFFCKETIAEDGYEFSNPFRQQSFLSRSNSYFFGRKNKNAFSRCDYQSCSVPQNICPARRDLRLGIAPIVSCVSDANFSIWPTAGIMFALLVVGFPILQWKLVKISSIEVKKMPLINKGSESENWMMQCSNSSSCCVSLFSNFKHKWRYFDILPLMLSIIVMTSHFWSSQYDESAKKYFFTTSGVSYLAFGALISISRPFNCNTLNIFEALTHFANSFHCLAGFLVNIGATETTSFFYYLLLSVNVVPFLAVIPCLYFTRRWEKAVHKKLGFIKDENPTISPLLIDQAEENMEAKIDDIALGAENLDRGIYSDPEESGEEQIDLVSESASPTEEGVNVDGELLTSKQTETIEINEPRISEIENQESEHVETIAMTGTGNEDCQSRAATQIDAAVMSLVSVHKKAKKKPKRQDKKRKVLRRVVRTMDSILNTRLAKIMIWYSCALGCGGFIGLLLSCAGGILNGIQSNSGLDLLIPSSMLDEKSIRRLAHEQAFGIFSSWQEMQINCCCNGTLTEAELEAKNTVVELWKCVDESFDDTYLENVVITGDNGFERSVFQNNPKQFTYVLRTRKKKGKSGLGLRPYCSKTFNAGVEEPRYDTNFKKVKIQKSFSLRDVEDTILINLW